MSKLKYIAIPTFKENGNKYWVINFEKVKGSYYDYVGKTYASSHEAEDRLGQFLSKKGWRYIPTRNPLLLLWEKERHIIRCYRI